MPSDRTPTSTDPGAETLPGTSTRPPLTGGIRPSSSTDVTQLHVQTDPGVVQTATHLGKVWGDFRFERLLGKGGMGAVYLGRQVSLDRPVAIKVLPPHLSSDEQFRTRFQLEARAVAKLSNPHVVQVYAAGTHEGQHYFAMEFVEGDDLSIKLKHGFKPSPRESIELMIQAAKGLAAAGVQGVVHRDIKPGNMMIGRDGVLKLMDFGLAKLASEGQHLTMTGTVMGTVSYFSPEQGRGQPTDQRTDIYAMGVVLYELLCRRLPFTGPDATSVIYQHIHTDPTPPRQLDPGIGDDLELVVMTCLAKKTEDRYQTAQELLEDLESILAGKAPAHARLRRTVLPGRSRGPARMILAASVVVAAAAGVAWFVLRPVARDPQPVAESDRPPVAALAGIPATRSGSAPAIGASTASAVTAVVGSGSGASSASSTASDAVSPVRIALSAGDWLKAEALIAAGRSTGSPGPWDDLDHDRRRGQAAALVVIARAAVDKGEVEAAEKNLATARDLDPGASGLDAAQSALTRLNERRKAIATAVSEIDDLITRGELEGAERATARNQARFGSDPLLDEADKRVKGLIKAREEGIARARAENAARLLASAQESITAKDWTAAEKSLTEAAGLDPRSTDIAAAAKVANDGRERERTLATQVATALAERDLARADSCLASLKDHAPRSEALIQAQAAVAAERTKRDDEAKAAAALEAKLSGEARALRTRIMDRTQPLAEVTTAVTTWTSQSGSGRSDAAELLRLLADRTRQEQATAVLARLDQAVLGTDRAALDQVVADRAFADALTALHRWPNLVFTSTLDQASPGAGAGSIESVVVIRHALNVFPERSLRYRMRMDPIPGGFRITTATLQQ